MAQGQRAPVAPVNVLTFRQRWRRNGCEKKALPKPYNQPSGAEWIAAYRSWLHAR
jgi:hypothetical protein